MALQIPSILSNRHHTSPVLVATAAISSYSCIVLCALTRQALAVVTELITPNAKSWISLIVSELVEAEERVVSCIRSYRNVAAELGCEGCCCGACGNLRGVQIDLGSLPLLSRSVGVSDHRQHWAAARRRLTPARKVACQNKCNE